MNKVILLLISLVFVFIITPSSVSAHVVVKPEVVGLGAFQTFTISVPNEKEISTTSLRLIIPEGLNHVSPTVKPGWTIEIKKTDIQEDEKVTEISWIGGSIPVGQRDDFTFSAHVPSTESHLIWKAYQTYEDGTLVSWDQDQDSIKDLTDSQKEENENKEQGPYSQTDVINDLDITPIPENTVQTNSLKVVSYAALAISLISLTLQIIKKRE